MNYERKNRKSGITNVSGFTFISVDIFKHYFFELALILLDCDFAINF